MKLSFIYFILLLLILYSTITEAIKCQRWTKLNNDDVVKFYVNDCTSHCLMGYKRDGNDVFYEGDCSNGEFLNRCFHNEKNFVCGCDTFDECNKYKELLKKMKENNATVSN